MTSLLCFLQLMARYMILEGWTLLPSVEPTLSIKKPESSMSHSGERLGGKMSSFLFMRKEE